MAEDVSDQPSSDITASDSFPSSEYTGDADSFMALGANCPQCNRRLPCNKNSFRVRKITFWSLDDHLGCNVCSAILQAASHLYGHMSPSNRKSLLSFVVDPRKKSGIRVVNEDSRFKAQINVPENCPDEKLKIEFDVPRRLPTWNETIKKCRHWLTQCARHPRCKSHSPAYYPSRVLDISNAGSTGIVFLREHARRNVKSTEARYACLSYCWGKSQPIKLTRENRLEYVRSGLPIGYLPQTFQDAIQVTGELQINYLWIDSLCIVQDDRDDWKIEAAKMADVYGSSTVTIASASGADCNHSLFQKREQPTGRVSFFYGPEPGQEIIATSIDPHYHWQFANTYALRKRLPLQRRAWTLQEHILSPRTISFGDGEVVWECQSEMDCECGEVLVSADETTDRDDDFLSTLGMKGWFWSVLRKPRNSFPNLQSFWNWLIEQYANRSLTNESDRLIAIQGVINIVQQQLSLKILYGHWERDIVQSLGWFAHPNCFAPPQVWRAPSWSWLSLEFHSDGFRTIDLDESQESFTTEYLAMKELSKAYSDIDELWGTYPVGTLWLSADTCEGTMIFDTDHSITLEIPAFKEFEINWSSTGIHLMEFRPSKLSIKCIILCRTWHSVSSLICCQPGPNRPLTRVGFASYDHVAGIQTSPLLAGRFVKETVAIW